MTKAQPAGGFKTAGSAGGWFSLLSLAVTARLIPNRSCLWSQA